MSAASTALLQLVARACLAAVFLVSGITKALGWSGGLAEVVELGLPLPALALSSTIVVQLIGGFAVLTGVAARWGALALAAFTLLATLIAHAFWAAPPEVRGQEAVIFLEHLGLVGGLLLLVAVGPGTYSLSMRRNQRRRAVV